ncbi:hypothetical protein OROGR_000239 [Orobanche gracilis]
MAVSQSFAKHILVKSSRVCSVAGLSNSIPNRSSFSTQVSLEETTAEILNRINSVGEDPSISREEICLSYIRKLCADGNLLAAARLPENLRSKQIFVGPHAYNHLLEAADRMNDIEMLSQVFIDLFVSRGSVKLDSYLIVARAIGKHHDHTALLNFVARVCRSELPRIDIVLNRFIYALAKCGHPDSALLVVDHMKGLKCKPDLLTYNTVLAVLGRSGRADELLLVFEFMKTVDLITPDIVTYNTVLHCVRKMVDWISACCISRRWVGEKGIRPDSITYKALVESLGRSGNIEEALKVFYEIKRRVITPSVHIYRALIFSLKKMGKMELASEFSTEMNKLLRPASVVPRDSQYKSR